MKRLLFLLFILSCSAFTVQAQTTITFNLNLQQMLEDSTFVPGRDIVRITGSHYPLGRNNTVQMFDLEPVDSVYTAEINFSRRFNNEILKYNFEIVHPDEIKSEARPRALNLKGGEIETPPLHFNSFAM